MKIAVSGKGGVGKTTLSALLAQHFADLGRSVLAVDADPSPCLAGALAFPEDLAAKLSPISEMDELITERTGAAPGASGGFFTLNPRVDDIPERFSVLHEGVRLLEMGSVKGGGAGCICPESAMLNTLFTHLLFRKDEVLIMDMYAGVEHLGRATVDFVDAMIIVAEPSRRSLDTAERIRELSAEIGLKRLWLVGNKVRDDNDVTFMKEQVPQIPWLAALPNDSSVLEADRLGISAYRHSPMLRSETERIVQKLEEELS